jgi:hypothetical protein
VLLSFPECRAILSRLPISPFPANFRVAGNTSTNLEKAAVVSQGGFATDIAPEKRSLFQQFLPGTHV